MILASRRGRWYATCAGGRCDGLTAPSRAKSSLVVYAQPDDYLSPPLDAHHDGEPRAKKSCKACPDIVARENWQNFLLAHAPACFSARGRGKQRADSEGATGPAGSPSHIIQVNWSPDAASASSALPAASVRVHGSCFFRVPVSQVRHAQVGQVTRGAQPRASGGGHSSSDAHYAKNNVPELGLPVETRQSCRVGVGAG